MFILSYIKVKKYLTLSTLFIIYCQVHYMHSYQRSCKVVLVFNHNLFSISQIDISCRLWFIISAIPEVEITAVSSTGL